MDHTQAYFHCFTKTHAHVHLCRCQQACIEQSEKHTLTVCPCEDEGRTKQRKDGGSNAALPDSKSCANGWRRRPSKRLYENSPMCAQQHYEVNNNWVAVGRAYLWRAASALRRRGGHHAH